MNNQEKFKEDPLWQYINPERIEKAPEGFTAKTMSRIRFETESVLHPRRFRVKSYVPVISAIITAALIISAILVSGNETGFVGMSVIKYIKNLGFTLPQINMHPIFEINLPGWLLYVFIGILALTLFDRALFGIFHREKE
jgi:hypothetical protein